MSATATAVRARTQSELCVLVTEEYGCRHWFWFPGMRPDELERWWSELETVAHYTDDARSLPGEVVQASGGDDEEEEEERLDDDLFDLHVELDRGGDRYRAHLHEDEDSCLTAPDGRQLLHRGCRPWPDGRTRRPARKRPWWRFW